jgi:hypothetical protein
MQLTLVGAYQRFGKDLRFNIQVSSNVHGLLGPGKMGMKDRRETSVNNFYQSNPVVYQY